MTAAAPATTTRTAAARAATAFAAQGADGAAIAVTERHHARHLARDVRAVTLWASRRIIYFRQAAFHFVFGVAVIANVLIVWHG
jgi:hypothetical protein